MHVIATDIPTDEASRYLQQLCKHWSHKFEVSFTPSEGRVPFPNGATCTMSATSDALALRVEAADEAEAGRMAGVVINHLQRFAFRAPLVVPDWRAA
jgi:uncharacterized protein